MTGSSSSNGLIYADHAATSWPKPDGVAFAMQEFLASEAGSPGRSGHRMSLTAARVVFAAREAVAGLLGVADSANVVFTANATHALNIAIQGLLGPGDHVITTAMEHNSVMRVLGALEARSAVLVDTVSTVEGGGFDLVAFEALFRDTTRLVVVQHGSNVNGHVNPVRQIGAICRRRGVPMLVDAAQTVGCLPLDMARDHIDLLAFSGHKGLLGPTGIGGLCLSGRVFPEPLYMGGSGSRSEQTLQPEFMPDRLEAGTPNAVGIAGLLAGIEHVRSIGVEAVAAHEQGLRARLVSGLSELPGLRVFSGRLAVVSFTVDGMRPSDIGLRLDQAYGILTRVGLHCAPAAHEVLGTRPEGTVRVSLGASSTAQEVDRIVAAVKAIVRA